MQFINKIKQNYDQWARVTPQGLLYDRALFWLFVVLLLIGLVAVTSASMPYSARVFNDTFYFAKRDAVYVLLSLATCYLTLQISSSQWEKWHAKIFFIAIVLLILVLGIGTSVNGAKRLDFFRDFKFPACGICEVSFNLFPRELFYASL